jgi:hypothetical protein
LRELSLLKAKAISMRKRNADLPFSSCKEKPDDALQLMRATILRRHPTLYLQPQDDARAGRAPTQDSPEMLYWGSVFNPKEFQRDFGRLN